MLPSQETIAIVLCITVAIMSAVVIITEKIMDRRDAKRK